VDAGADRAALAGTRVKAVTRIGRLWAERTMAWRPRRRPCKESRTHSASAPRRTSVGAWRTRLERDGLTRTVWRAIAHPRRTKPRDLRRTIGARLIRSACLRRAFQVVRSRSHTWLITFVVERFGTPMLRRWARYGHLAWCVVRLTCSDMRLSSYHVRQEERFVRQ
jgi:hypothetical protein